MKRTSKTYIKNQLDEIAKRDFEKGQIVLIGDCIIGSVPMEDYFNESIIYNNGICGDTTTTLTETLYKRAIKYKPDKLFISIGSNDLAYESFSVKEIYNNIVDIIETVKKRSKNTKIYIVTTLPVHPALVGTEACEKTERIDNFDVEMLNYYLKNYARKKRIKVVDAYKHMKNEFDQLRLEYTTDGFHLNPQGYEQFTKLIKQFV